MQSDNVHRWLPLDGPEDGEECHPTVPGACQAGGGHCEACDTWEYYPWKDWKKRAEAIRLADPYIDFSSSDHGCDLGGRSG